MPLFVDARIPVLFGVKPQPGDAVLLPSDTPAHPAGCACCVARPPEAAGLDKLFLDRVRGSVPWFTRVVVPHEHAGLRQAIEADAVLAARFRLG